MHSLFLNAFIWYIHSLKTRLHDKSGSWIISKALKAVFVFLGFLQPNNGTFPIYNSCPVCTDILQGPSIPLNLEVLMTFLLILPPPPQRHHLQSAVRFWASGIILLSVPVHSLHRGFPLSIWVCTADTPSLSLSTSRTHTPPFETLVTEW